MSDSTETMTAEKFWAAAESLAEGPGLACDPALITSVEYSKGVGTIYPPVSSGPVVAMTLDEIRAECEREPRIVVHGLEKGQAGWWYFAEGKTRRPAADWARLASVTWWLANRVRVGADAR